jgi:hypothetical protein
LGPYVLATGAILAFWGGVLMAAGRYPTAYDWRYMPVSNLFSASRNPNGHVDAASGVVICSLVCMVWVGHKDRRATAGARALLCGALGMAFAAALPPSLLPLRKGHELLALLGFAGMCLGVVLMTFQVTNETVRRAMRGSPAAARLYAGLVAACAVAPVICAGIAQAYVFYALPALHWVNLSWRARGVPVYLSFAFWEWITCAVLSLYLPALVVMTWKTGNSGTARGARGAPPFDA